jgi:hypothetical protein
VEQEEITGFVCDILIAGAAAIPMQDQIGLMSVDPPVFDL